MILFGLLSLLFVIGSLDGLKLEVSLTHISVTFNARFRTPF